MSILKSILAILAGFVVTVALSTGTDFILEGAGILPHGNINTAWFIIVAVVVYRNIYNVIGSFVVALLAPRKPMVHVMVIGSIGFVGSLIATIMTWNMPIGPHWYPIIITITALPSAWLGGKLNAMRAGRDAKKVGEI
jgi:hypothetical protein